MKYYSIQNLSPQIVGHKKIKNTLKHIDLETVLYRTSSDEFHV
jgi:hypothetical protein